MRDIAIRLLTFCIIGSLCICIGALAQEDFTEGLVLYLAMDEGEGGEAMDASSNENNGTVSGCEWVDEGKFDKALKIPASGSITVRSSESLMIQDGITISLWLFYEEKGALEQRGLFVPNGWNLDMHNNAGRIEIHNNGGYHGCVNKKPPAVGAWNFIAATYDKSAMRFYMNGEKTSECPLAGKMDAPNSNLLIGNTGGMTAMVGIYDDIRIYNIALTGEEIKALYEYVPGQIAVDSLMSLVTTWAEIRGRATQQMGREEAK